MDNQEPLSFTEMISLSQQNIALGSSLSLADILVALFSSLICALAIAFIYRTTYQGVMYQKSFAISIVLASLITTMIIMVISGNLILSLGMVGALSIVRFRAAVKDPLDIIFMFWSISVGIANGVANLKVSFTATLVIAVIILLLSKLPAIKPAKILIIKINPSKENELFNLFKSSKTKFKLKSRSQKESYLELIGEIRLQDDDAILNSINSLDSSVETNLISYNSNILDV
mgnify:CR=1 FL=1